MQGAWPKQQLPIFPKRTPSRGFTEGKEAKG